MNWNQNAIARIRQCFPAPPIQGPVGRKPINYLNDLRTLVSYQPQRCDGSSTQPLEVLHPCPLGQCSRVQIRRICIDSDVDVLEAYAAVMAWGGQSMKWFRTSIQHHAALRPLLCQLRASTNTRSQDFGATQRVAAGITGLGISFYTKLLYFFRPTPDAYILDQWTAKSIRVLTGNIITLTNVGTPDPATTPQQYEDFCDAIDQLGQILGGWTGEQVEQALFDRPGGCWRTYVEENLGRLDPGAPVAPEEEIGIDDTQTQLDGVSSAETSVQHVSHLCVIWTKLITSSAYHSSSGTSIQTMGGNAPNVRFYYDPGRNMVRVWRTTGKPDFWFGEADCEQICQHYQRLLRNGAIPPPPQLGGAALFTNPQWPNPTLGQINTPYAAAVIRFVW